MQIINRTRYATFDVELVLEQVKKLLREQYSLPHPTRGIRLELKSTGAPCCPLPVANGDVCSGYRVVRHGQRVVITVPPSGCHNKALGALRLTGLALPTGRAKSPLTLNAPLNVALVASRMPHDFVIKPMKR